MKTVQMKGPAGRGFTAGAALCALVLCALSVDCQYNPTYAGSKCAPDRACPAGYVCDLNRTPAQCRPKSETSQPDGSTDTINGSGGRGAGGNGAGGNIPVGNGSGGSGTGGLLGGSGGYAGAGTALVPNSDGWIARSTNVFGIQGAWYVFSDGIGADGTSATSDCVTGGHPASACAKVTSPGQGKFPNTGGRMCFVGTVAAVVNSPTTGMPDYDNIWGATIALDFNYDLAQSPPMGTFNAPAKGFKGLKFDLTGSIPAYGLRVGFSTPSTDAIGPAYWGATPGYDPSPTVIGTNVVYLSQVVHPTGAAFDPTMLVRLQIIVPTSTDGGAPFDFCISNVSGLTQ